MATLRGHLFCFVCFHPPVPTCPRSEKLQRFLFVGGMRVGQRSRAYPPVRRRPISIRARTPRPRVAVPSRSPRPCPHPRPLCRAPPRRAPPCRIPTSTRSRRAWQLCGWRTMMKRIRTGGGMEGSGGNGGAARGGPAGGARGLSGRSRGGARGAMSSRQSDTVANENARVVFALWPCLHRCIEPRTSRQGGWAGRKEHTQHNTAHRDGFFFFIVNSL